MHFWLCQTAQHRFCVLVSGFCTSRRLSLPVERPLLASGGPIFSFRSKNGLWKSYSYFVATQFWHWRRFGLRMGCSLAENIGWLSTSWQCAPQNMQLFSYRVNVPKIVGIYMHSKVFLGNLLRSHVSFLSAHPTPSSTSFSCLWMVTCNFFCLPPH